MTLIRRLLSGGVIISAALWLSGVAAEASAGHLARLPMAAGAPAPAAVRAPRVFLVNPLRVNPQLESNIMITGQNLTPASRVLVGGHPATTVEATGYTLLAKLPDGLSSGSYPLEVVNDAGSAMATDPVIIDDGGQGPSQASMLLAGGLLILLILVMRLARNPSRGTAR
jgi:hypothetical protein